MKTQRLALALLVLNLVLLALFFTQRRAAAPGVQILARQAPLAGRKTTSITLAGAEGRQRVITP